MHASLGKLSSAQAIQLSGLRGAIHFRVTLALTFQEALSARDNALNFIRLLLAIVVIYDHAWPIGGYQAELVFKTSDWAVNGFFAISGYLIAGSRMRLGMRAFLMNRVLRIYPAYWVLLLVTAFILSPFVAVFTGEAWDAGSATSYVGKNASLYIFQWGVDETLVSVPMASVWNGSLWTLFYEFAAYIAAGILLSFSWARRYAIWVVTGIFVALLVGQVLSHGPLEVTTNIYLNGMRLGCFFLAGMLLYFVGDRIRLRWSYVVGAAAVFVVLGLFGAAEWFGQLPFAFVTLWLGSRLAVRIGSRNDVSYGVYIWAFPVQQILVASGTSWLGPLGSFLLATALTLPLAWLSWCYIEKPAMGLRSRVPCAWLGSRPQ